MNPEQIKAMLVKVFSDLAYIERSQVLQEVAELPQASPEKRPYSGNDSRHGDSEALPPTADRTSIEVHPSARQQSRHRTRQSF